MLYQEFLEIYRGSFVSFAAAALDLAEFEDAQRVQASLIFQVKSPAEMPWKHMVGGDCFLSCSIMYHWLGVYIKRTSQQREFTLIAEVGFYLSNNFLLPDFGFQSSVFISGVNSKKGKIYGNVLIQAALKCKLKSALLNESINI